MNSHRDNVKDAVFDILDAQGIPADELKCVITDAVFEALGITEEEQDKHSEDTFFKIKHISEALSYGGEFTETVLTSGAQRKVDDLVPDHYSTFGAAPRERQAEGGAVAMPPPEIARCWICYGSFQKDKMIMDTCEECLGEDIVSAFRAREARKKELLTGGKYTYAEFKAFANAERVPDSDTGKGWYLSLVTPICTYAQSYDDDIALEIAKTTFANAHYHMYLDDYYGRSKELAKDKMDKEQVSE